MTARIQVSPIHTKIPGRFRLAVPGLRGSVELRSLLEARLDSLDEVKRASASTVTGNLLVHCSAETDWHRIAEVVESSLGRNEAAGGTEAAAPAAAAENSRWRRLPAGELIDALDTSAAKGLNRHEAELRLQRFGPNIPGEAAGRSRTEILRDQFKSLPLLLLAVETAIALAGGAMIEAILLMLILAGNAGVGFFIDRRTEQAIVASKKKPRPATRVIRDGKAAAVPGEALVPGDLLVLKPGTFIGADCRVVKAVNLKIDESMLTGESIPVDKYPQPADGWKAPEAEARDLAFMGTLVVGGKGLAVVAATGALTEFGKLHSIMEETVPPETPLMRRLYGLTGRLFRAGMVVCAGGLLVGLFRGRGFLQSLRPVIGMAAAAIPAGLPSAATLNMAIGIRKLKRDHVAVHRLYALESLGAVETICFDKTGTLTKSRIRVMALFAGRRRVQIRDGAFWISNRRIDPLADRDLQRLLQAGILCNESKAESDPETGKEMLSGSPTEVALLQAGLLSGLDAGTTYRRHPMRRVWHRGETRRYMVTVHDGPGKKSRVFVKGDPAQILGMCSRQLRAGRRVPLTPKAEAEIEQENERMAAGALRVLGFAYREEETGAARRPKGDLTWLGLVGMAEPIRGGVAAMMERLHRAGIETVMITGDQSPTAYAVAQKVRLSGNREPKIVDSSRFDAMPDSLLEALTRDVQVFARVNPAQKLQLVRAYRSSGRVVAMTGDGINDAPALRAADIGIAMGESGTEVAREVADIVLERDNIASMFDAIREGRAAYRNLKRSVRFFITANFSDMFATAVILPAGWGAGLAAARPFQRSLLTDLAPGLALLMEPQNPSIAEEPPRKREAPFFTVRESAGLLMESAVIAGGALAAGGYGILRYGPGRSAATLMFETLSAAKALHALTCRPMPPEKDPNRGVRRNPALSAAMIAAFAAQIGSLAVPPLRKLLGVAPLGPIDLAVLGFSAMATRRVNLWVRRQRRAERPPR